MRSLPERPDLRQVRRQAKELLRAARAGRRDARERMGAVARRQDLAGAQLTLAREFGFTSWGELKRGLAAQVSQGAEGHAQQPEVPIWDSDRAQGMAAAHLSGPLPERWRHVQGVALRARQVASSLRPNDGAVLIAAAWLLDLGYAPRLRRTGAHQIDGAAFLREAGQDRLAALVAHHSQSRFELELLGLGDHLAAYPDEDSVVSAALTYCDVTTEPDGSAAALWEHLDEARRAYGPEHVCVRAQDLARPHVHRAVAETELRLPGELRTPPAREDSVEELRQSLDALGASHWTRRLTLWVRDRGRIVHPYCYTTGDDPLYVHHPAWGVIAVYRWADILRLEEAPVAERRGRGAPAPGSTHHWRITVLANGCDEPYVYERAQLSFAGDGSARAILVQSAGNLRSVFAEAVVRRLTKELTGMVPPGSTRSTRTARGARTARHPQQPLAARTGDGRTQLFLDAYAVCGTEGITVWRGEAQGLRPDDRLADYRYRDVDLLVGVPSVSATEQQSAGSQASCGRGRDGDGNSR